MSKDQALEGVTLWVFMKNPPTADLGSFLRNECLGELAFSISIS